MTRVGGVECIVPAAKRQPFLSAAAGGVEGLLAMMDAGGTLARQSRRIA